LTAQQQASETIKPCATQEEVQILRKAVEAVRISDELKRVKYC
jgi:hypothetical protein